MDWNTFSTSWGFNYAFWVATALALAAMLYPVLARSRKKLVFQPSHLPVINDTKNPFAKSFKITFDGIEIPHATYSVFTVWNAGNQPVRKADVAEKSPLAFRVAAGERILQATVLKSAEEAMDVRLDTTDAKQALLQFDYIEPKQGFVCALLHTGTPESIELGGKLIGTKTPPQKERLPAAREDSWDTILSNAAVMVLAPLTFYTLIFEMLRPLVWTTSHIVLTALSGILALLFCVSGASTVYLNIARRSVRLEPVAPKRVSRTTNPR